MEVSFTIEVRCPNVEIESVVVDERGNADLTLSADGVKAKCRVDADGRSHGTIEDALLSLAHIHINNKNGVIIICPNMSLPVRWTSATM